MKKNLTIAFCLFFVLICQAKNIEVYPGPGYPLSAAIRNASGGDTLSVHAGLYREDSTIVISKPLILLGKGLPTIDGQTKYEIMVITSNFVIVEGFRFINSGQSSYNDIAALRILNAGHILIRNNVFEHNLFGVYSQHAYYTTIANNKFSSTGKDEQNSANGIHCWRSDHMLISTNYITGHRDGIYFEFVTNSTIINNISEKNIRYGLHFMFSSDNRYFDNRFIENGSGVAVMYSKGVHMKGNTFTMNWGDAAYGILMKDITDSRVEKNKFIQNTAGIYMEGCNRIQVTHNNFTSNGWALRMQASSTENEISSNNFSGNSFDVSTNGSLQLNHFSGNYWDNYDGYDLNRDGKGDVPYRPVSMFSIIVERNPSVLMMFRSFMVGMMDKTEKILPGITPIELIDNSPLMKPVKH